MASKDFDIYISDWIQKSNGEKVKEPDFYKSYLNALAFATIGNYEETVSLLTVAKLQMQQIKNEFEWERLYYSVVGLLATSLDYLGKLNVDAAEQNYVEVVKLNPTGIYIGDYAIFLHKRKRHYELANSFFLKALEMYPSHSSIHFKYAGFLRHVRKDDKAAEIHYCLACEANPLNSDALGSYASFLHGTGKNIKRAETYYEKSLAVDPTHTNNLCNYGLFLSEERNLYGKAEELYMRALNVSPDHANTLYNLAVMLDTRCKRKHEAEKHYRRCVEVEPKHAYALYNLAVLLEEKLSVSSSEKGGKSQLDEEEENIKTAEDREIQASITKKERTEISDFYKRAVEADPGDSTTLADYGRYLLTKMVDPVAAEKVLLQAIKADPQSEIALFNLAVLYHKHSTDLQAACNCLKKILENNPKHAVAMHMMARVCVDKFKRILLDNASNVRRKIQPSTGTGTGTDIAPLDEAMDYFEKAAILVKEPSKIVSEYFKIISRLGNYKQKLRAVASMDALTQKIFSANAGEDDFCAIRDLEELRISIQQDRRIATTPR